MVIGVVSMLLIAYLVEVPGRLYEFEVGRRELKSPRREIGRDIVVSAAGSISVPEFYQWFYVFKTSQTPPKIDINKQTNKQTNYVL